MPRNSWSSFTHRVNMGRDNKHLPRPFVFGSEKSFVPNPLQVSGLGKQIQQVVQQFVQTIQSQQRTQITSFTGSVQSAIPQLLTRLEHTLPFMGRDNAD